MGALSTSSPLKETDLLILLLVDYILLDKTNLFHLQFTFEILGVLGFWGSNT